MSEFKGCSECTTFTDSTENSGCSNEIGCAGEDFGASVDRNGRRIGQELPGLPVFCSQERRQVALSGLPKGPRIGSFSFADARFLFSLDSLGELGVYSDKLTPLQNVVIFDVIRTRVRPFAASGNREAGNY